MNTGIAPSVWLSEPPAALATALELLAESQEDD